MTIRKKTKLVYGVGRNDSESQVSTCETIAGRQKVLWRCPIYRTWKHMLMRCYDHKYHAHHPTYAGCSVAPEWHSFSVFRSWMERHCHEGKHLDKDLLFTGNKVYSPEACAFVSAQLNNFTTESGASRGEFSIGACWHKRDRGFVAQCKNPFTGKQEHLGLFTDPGAAHEAWRARKHAHACAYADMQADPRIAAALRSRYASTSLHFQAAENVARKVVASVWRAA